MEFQLLYYFFKLRPIFRSSVVTVARRLFYYDKKVNSYNYKLNGFSNTSKSNSCLPMLRLLDIQKNRKFRYCFFFKLYKLHKSIYERSLHFIRFHRKYEGRWIISRNGGVEARMVGYRSRCQVSNSLSVNIPRFKWIELLKSKQVNRQKTRRYGEFWALPPLSSWPSQEIL